MATEIRVHRRTTDRILFTLVAIGVPLIVLTGYARTYYFKTWFGTPALPGPLVHAHGMLMSGWIILFGAQTWLIETRRVKTHIQLGILGAFLAVAIVTTGTLAALAATARGGAPPGQSAVPFLIIPLGDILVFAVLVGLAIYYRKRVEIHKRLMLLTAVNLLAAAIARIPLGVIETYGPWAFFGFTDLVMLGCIAFDTIRNKRLHPAFMWGAPLIIIFQPLRLMFAGTAAWASFAELLLSPFK